MRNQLILGTLVALLTILSSNPSIGRLDEEPSNILRQWKLLAESTDNLGFTSIENASNTTTGRSREETYRFVRDSGGRASLSVDFASGSGLTRVLDIREDGRSRFRLFYARDYPDLLSMVEISPQVSTDNRFDGHMPRALWAIMPFGKTLHQIVMEGGTIIPGERGSLRPVLKASDGDLSLEGTLSTHDGLPEVLRLVSPQGIMTLRVTKFQSFGGRWFPTEGSGAEEDTRNGRTVLTRSFRFLLRDISVNDDISDSRFSEPACPPGVILLDKATKKTRIVGGPEARRAWEKEHAGSDAQRGKPIVVDNTVRTSWLGISLAITSALLAVVALHLHMKNR